MDKQTLGRLKRIEIFDFLKKMLEPNIFSRGHFCCL